MVNKNIVSGMILLLFLVYCLTRINKIDITCDISLCKSCSLSCNE